ncbi:unnamed protein product [Owenia fusiformis]|uniref:Uncharacterized protein n=1 Tax=Owenia fusiformis TaxID=6347 RepID=A0A8S4PHL0_OWEFU|nr:unnamed protein product [Owenia fusiformis]
MTISITQSSSDSHVVSKCSKLVDTTPVKHNATFNNEIECNEMDNDNEIENRNEMSDSINMTSNDNNSNNDGATDENNDELLREFANMMPQVINRLSDDGSLTTIRQFFHLITTDVFPLDNIAYRCFLDVLEWMGCGASTQFRYRFPDTIRFWRIGYRLFKGKFLRYMNGVNDGGISNFIVPTKAVLKKNSEIKEDAMPGINSLAIDDIAEKDRGSMKTRKIVSFVPYYYPL